MEKVVKIALPKGKETTDVKVRVSEGELIVTYNLEEKFSPKDGDFLVSSSGNVFIYNGKGSYSCYGTYAGVNCAGGIVVNAVDGASGTQWTQKNGCRYATEQEKSDFLERLKEEHNLAWNEETKKLETIRWRANRTETYYRIVEATEPVIAKSFESRCMTDDQLHASGNYFRTREAAKKVADQIKEILKNSKAE